MNTRRNNMGDDLELKIRKGYSENVDGFNVLAKWLEDALGQVVIHDSNDIYTHKVRVKRIGNLLKKIDDKIGKEIKSNISEDKVKWGEITEFKDAQELVDDFVGARIIVHTFDFLQELHNIIMDTEHFHFINVTSHEFNNAKVKIDNLKNKDGTQIEKSIRSNNRGYIGVHYIIRPKPRDKCWEKEPHIFPKFELQIRSLLQETWGEIQHRVIYKGRMPEDEKESSNKDFANLSELLVSVDKMFSKLKKQYDE